MDWASNEFVQVLSFLLPGFVAAWVFHGLTPYPKPSQFERTVFALVLTAAVNSIVLCAKELTPGSAWPARTTPAIAVAAAILLGLLLAFAANHDIAHAFLRKIGVTRQNAMPSEWYSAFSSRRSYVVLHLAGERRLYGWPDEWPASPTTGYFLLLDAEWLLQDGSSVCLATVDTILVPVSDVEMVEFMVPVQKQERPDVEARVEETDNNNPT